MLVVTDPLGTWHLLAKDLVVSQKKSTYFLGWGTTPYFPSLRLSLNTEPVGDNNKMKLQAVLLITEQRCQTLKRVLGKRVRERDSYSWSGSQCGMFRKLQSAWEHGQCLERLGK